MTTDSDIDQKEGLWLVRISLILSAIVLAWFVVAFTLALGGCVARSAYVDQLSQHQADTSATVANLAKSHENLAIEVGSTQAPVAGKLAMVAEMQAADSLDLADQKSGVEVNLVPMVQGAMTGNWVEVGMGLLTLAGVGGALHQRTRANKAHALAQEVAELEPGKAREVLKTKKV